MAGKHIHPLRPVEEGLIYHVINRGNNRQRVFRKPPDFEAFLATLAELKERKPLALHGYCLLDNHFHLLVRPGETSISHAPSAWSLHDLKTRLILAARSRWPSCE